MTTAALVGLIWTIQVVHYPSFRYVAEADFKDFHRFHERQITLIVAPAMVVELMCALLLFAARLDPMTGINLASVAAIWLITFFVSVPLHRRLQSGKEPRAIEALISTNWWRTAIWSLRLAVFGFVF